MLCHIPVSVDLSDASNASVLCDPALSCHVRVSRGLHHPVGRDLLPLADVCRA
jgi:hypothetical protein